MSTKYLFLLNFRLHPYAELVVFFFFFKGGKKEWFSNVIFLIGDLFIFFAVVIFELWSLVLETLPKAWPEPLHPNAAVMRFHFLFFCSTPNPILLNRNHLFLAYVI